MVRRSVAKAIRVRRGTMKINGQRTNGDVTIRGVVLANKHHIPKETEVATVSLVFVWAPLRRAHQPTAGCSIA